MSPGVGPMNTGIASWDMGYPGTSQQLLPSILTFDYLFCAVPASSLSNFVF